MHGKIFTFGEIGTILTRSVTAGTNTRIAELNFPYKNQTYMVCLNFRFNHNFNGDASFLLMNGQTTSFSYPLSAYEGANSYHNYNSAVSDYVNKIILFIEINEITLQYLWMNLSNSSLIDTSTYDRIWTFIL